MSEQNIVKTMCRMCDNHCGIDVYIEDGKPVHIEGNNHYWNKGRLCVKGRAGVDIYNDPNRLLKPLKKVNGSFVEIELEQALDELAERILKISDEYGKRAFSIWKGEAVGFFQEEEMARRFIHAFGSPNYFSNDSQCFVGRYIGYSLVAGTWMAQPDFKNSDCIVLWGANPPNAHPNMTRYIMNAKAGGGKLIVIDPRMSEVSRQAHIYAQVKPGTDGAVALGLLRLLIRKGYTDDDFIKNHTVGYEALADYVEQFTEDAVERESGACPEVLHAIADAVGRAAPRVVNYIGNGLEHHENGINNIRAVACIDGIIGSFDRKGGQFISESFGQRDLTLYDEVPLQHLDPIGADKFPVLYDYRKECHTMTAMDTILSEKPYPLKGMIVIGANPALTNPNTAKVKKALSSLDLLVVRELFMTETAELADYVLPAATYLERSEIHIHSMFQAATLSNRVATIPGVQDEYTFLHDIAHRIGAGSYFPWNNEDELNEWLVEPTGVSMETLKEHPEGYIYKPMRFEKWREEPFKTRSGKIELYSQYLADLGYDGLPVYKSPEYIAKPDKAYPFVMVTGARKVLYLHGRNRNVPRFRTAIPNGEVEMHPADAEKLGIQDGDTVVVTSEVGSVEIPAKIRHEKEILPGVIQITHGWKKTNVNLITYDDRPDPIDGFPLMKSVKVRVEKK